MNLRLHSSLQRLLPCLFFSGLFRPRRLSGAPHRPRHPLLQRLRRTARHHPRHPRTPFFLENDSYVWLSHARDLLNSGDLHLRYTYMDNAHHGRPMHWSHLLLCTILLPIMTIIAIAHLPATHVMELGGFWGMPAGQIVFPFRLFPALSSLAIIRLHPCFRTPFLIFVDYAQETPHLHLFTFSGTAP